MPNFVIKIRISIRNIRCGFLRGTNIFESHKMRVGWEVLTNKIFTNAVTGIFLVGDIPAFVAREGDEVVLTCPVNTPGRPNIFVLLQIFFVYKYFPPECGDYHSLKWYRDTSRVYVYSPIAQFSNAEGSLMDRWAQL